MKHYAQLTKTDWIPISEKVFENAGRSGCSAIAFLELDDESGTVRILEGIDTPDEIRDLFDYVEFQDESIGYENFEMDIKSYAKKEMLEAVEDEDSWLHEIAVALTSITGKSKRQQSYRDRETAKGRKGRLLFLTDEENLQVRRRLAEIRA